MDFKCKKCGLNLGEMEKGKIRNKAVLLCDVCWDKAEAAMGVAEIAREQTPDFIKSFVKGFTGGK